MLDKFWEGVGGKLADRWAALAVPALVFWLGGLIVWAYSGGLLKLANLTGWLNQQSTATQIIVLLALMFAIAFSGVLINRMTTPMLRLLEGYWPSWLAWLRHRLIARFARRALAEDTAWQQLIPHVLAQPGTATAEQLATFARLDQRRRRRPSTTSRYLPTRLGNVLRAAETWPSDKYGLDAVVVWPRLWLVLPETARQDLIAARAALDAAVSATVWGVLFCVFSVWNPLAILIGLVVAVVAATIWAPPRAEVFADLIEAAYDVHRTDLYKQLRWPLPINPEQEHTQGQQLTAYLWRGSDDTDPTFTAPP